MQQAIEHCHREYAIAREGGVPAAEREIRPGTKRCEGSAGYHR